MTSPKSIKKDFFFHNGQFPRGSAITEVLRKYFGISVESQVPSLYFESKGIFLLITFNFLIAEMVACDSL